MRRSQGDLSHRLTEHDIKLIVQQIRELNVELRPTWAKVIELTKLITKREFSRQSLSAHEVIAAEYRSAVERHWNRRGKQGGGHPKIPSDDLKSQKIAKLEMKVQVQTELIEALQDLLVRYVGNAQAAGISQEAMEAPLKARAEWRSDVDSAAERTKEARRKQRAS